MKNLQLQPLVTRGGARTGRGGAVTASPHPLVQG